MCLIRSLGAFSLNNTKKSTCVITNIWRCHSDSSSLDSMLCANLLQSVLLAYHQSEDKASCPWLIKHPILAALQSFLSSCISLFEQLFWKLQHCPDQRPHYCKLLPRRLWPNTNILYLADTSAVQSTRSWGIVNVIIMLLFSKSSKIPMNLLLQM